MSFIGNLTKKVSSFVAENFRLYAGKTDTQEDYYIDLKEYTEYLLANSGESDHTQLDNLAWSASGHTGTANYLAGFGVSGESVDIDPASLGFLTEETDPIFNAWLLATPPTYPLTVTSIKTGAYNANANELIPCNISATSFSVTLPTTPPEGTVVKTKLTAIGLDKVLTVLAGGSAVFNRVGGTASITYTLIGEWACFTYDADLNVWFVESGAPTYNFAANFPGIDITTPITDSDISFNTSTLVLSIVPPLGYMNIFVDGNGVINRFVKTGTINFPAITNTSGTWFFYFDSTGTAVSTQTPWTTADFPTIAPVYRILWNATLYDFTITSGNVVEGDTYTNNGQTFTIRQTYTGVTTIKTSGTGDPQASGTLTRATGTGDATLTFSAFSVAPRLVAPYIEYHPNSISSDVHEWMHLMGSIWRDGFTMANNALTSGAPNADGRNSVIALSTGSNIDDNLEYTVTNDSTPLANWQQDLGNTTPASLNATNSALFKVFRQNASGLITFRDATRFPFDYSTITSVPNYITALGVRTPVTTSRFFVYFVYATQNPVPGEALKLVSATQDFTSITDARAYTWTNIQNTYTIFGLDTEIRPLYRLIFEYRIAYDSGCKSSVLRETQDIRKAAVTSTTVASGSIPASSVTSIATTNITTTNSQSDKEQIDIKAIINIPATQPVIDTGVMTLDCNSHWQAMFEGRTSVGTLTITDDFTIALSNATDTKLISLTLTLTGTNQITFPNTVMCSNPSTKGTWASNVLTLASGTGVIVEFQLIWYATSSKWLLKVSEEAVV